MRTVASDFEKVKELVESDNPGDRKIGMTLFDRINDENEISTAVFHKGDLYFIGYRKAVTGFNDYGEVLYKLNRIVAEFEDAMLRGTLIFNEQGTVHYIERKDILFAVTQ